MKIQLRSPAEKEPDLERLWGWVGLAALGGMVAWLKLLGPPPLRCAFRTLTGIPCPTCGSTRSLEAFAGGDLLESLRMNPLALAVFLSLLLYIPYALAASHLRLPRVRIRLGERDWRVIRWAVPALGAALWAFLILDGR